MAVEDVVEVLVEYCHDQETFEDLHGAEAVIVVRDLVDLLRRELGGQLDYDTLWAEFESSPEDAAADLSGALEAMVEADPGLAHRLDELLREYYATAGATPSALDGGAPGSDDVHIMPGLSSVERPEEKPTRHTDDAGEGTYLYGNVPAGDITVGQALEMGSEVLERLPEGEVPSLDVRGLFEQLRQTAAHEPKLSDPIRERLRDKLEELEAEIMLGDEADEEEIVGHLRRIGELSPEVLELVLTGLRYTRSEAQVRVQNAIQQVAGRQKNK